MTLYQSTSSFFSSLFRVAVCGGAILFVQESAAQSSPLAAAPQAAQKPLAPAPAPTSGFAQPEYPGGDAALIAFLGQNLHYPTDACKDGAEGRVDVSFWIDEQGRPYGFGAIDAPHPSLAAEALRAMRLMPSWIPGRRDGKVVPLLVHVPIVFKRPANAGN